MAILGYRERHHRWWWCHDFERAVSTYSRSVAISHEDAGAADSRTTVSIGTDQAQKLAHPSEKKWSLMARRCAIEGVIMFRHALSRDTLRQGAATPMATAEAMGVVVSLQGSKLVKLTI